MLREDDIDLALLGRYFTNDCTPEERVLVDGWIERDPGRRAEVAALRRWWENAASIPSAARVDGMWNALAARIRQVTPGAERSRPSPPIPVRVQRESVLPLEPRRGRFVPRLRLAAGLAAALALVTVGATYLRNRDDAANAVATNDPALKEFTTARGQRATIRLADGTRVELGFASSLRVRPFEGNRRELHLEGEAVFDVVHDEKRSFVVHAGNSITEDLGTVFGVRAYPGDSVVRVVVMSGRVALRDSSERSAVARATVLGPGQLGRLDAHGSIDVQSGVDTTEYVTWLSGRVAFRNVPLAEIAAELERRFDVSIRVPVDARALRVTVDLPEASLANVLDAVTVPLGLRHRRADGAIVLER
jgi:transmembrane sensor